MPISALRGILSAAALDFAWNEWGQMGLSAAPDRASHWVQDPEALIVLTLEVARDDPRLFDEVLDWVLRNESVVSARRLQNLCEEPEDKRMVGGTLAWVADQRRRRSSPRELDGYDREPQRLFRGLAGLIRAPDPPFLAHGLLRGTARPSGKSRPPDLTTPINLAFRLRHLLGVSARAESVRVLLTSDAPTASVGAVASAAGYAKRNVHAALASLHAAGVVSLTTVGPDQRYGVDQGRWAYLLGLDADDLPPSRDWLALFGAVRAMLRWLDRPELAGFSEYLRASQADDLVRYVHPRLASAGVITPPRRGGGGSWEDLVDTVRCVSLALGQHEFHDGRTVRFELYADAAGQHRWRLNATNGRVVARSSDSYSCRDNARAAVERLRRDLGRYEYLVEPDDAGDYRWRARAGNGHNIATSAEAFASWSDADRAARGARELATAAAGP